MGSRRFPASHASPRCNYTQWGFLTIPQLSWLVINVNEGREVARWPFPKEGKDGEAAALPLHLLAPRTEEAGIFRNPGGFHTNNPPGIWGKSQVMPSSPHSSTHPSWRQQSPP